MRVSPANPRQRRGMVSKLLRWLAGQPLSPRQQRWRRMRRGTRHGR